MTNLDTKQWNKFKVVDGGFGTLVEVETKWSIIDLANALEYLDIQAEAEKAFSDRKGK